MSPEPNVKWQTLAFTHQQVSRHGDGIVFVAEIEAQTSDTSAYRRYRFTVLIGHDRGIRREDIVILDKGGKETAHLGGVRLHIAKQLRDRFIRTDAYRSLAHAASSGETVDGGPAVRLKRADE